MQTVQAVFLRKKLEFTDLNRKASLGMELDFVEKYFEIEKARFGDKIKLDLQIDAPLEHEVPILVLQPLVENSVRHGISKKMTGGTVWVRATVLGKNLCVEVQDDGIGIELERRKVLLGIALSNLILQNNPQISIVFMTAFAQYAVQAFDINAVDYLLKPVSKERLEKTVARLKGKKALENQSNKPFVQCFGEFEIFVNEEIVIWKNSKAKEILAYLIHKKGVPQSWQKIVDAIWPEYNTEKAHANFNATMYLLRRTLAEFGVDHILENKRGNYRIRKDEIFCDTYVFEQDAKRALLEGVS